MDLNAYRDAYVAFVDALRADYPNAHIFCLSRPMLSDGWPNADDQSATDLKTALTRVLEHYAAAGDDRVHKFEVTKTTGLGCGTHPNAEKQAALAAELEPLVRERPLGRSGSRADAGSSTPCEP